MVLAGQRAAADEDGVVGQQDRVEVRPRQAHRSCRRLRRVGCLRSTMAVLPVALLASSGPPPRIMTRWSCAGAAARWRTGSGGRITQAGYAGDGDRVGGQVHQDRALRVRVVHPAAREENPAVAEQEQVRVQGHAEEQPTCGTGSHARSRCPGRNLERRFSVPFSFSPLTAARAHRPAAAEWGTTVLAACEPRWCHCWVFGSKPTASGPPCPGRPVPPAEAGCRQAGRCRRRRRSRMACVGPSDRVGVEEVGAAGVRGCRVPGDAGVDALGDVAVVRAGRRGPGCYPSRRRTSPCPSAAPQRGWASTPEW